MSTGQRPFTITGWHVAAAMVAFFTVIVAVNLTMAAFAARSWTGLVVKNSYVASQNYNRKLEKARAQDALGWTSRLEPRADRIVLIVTDSAGAPVVLTTAMAVIGRPAFEQQDREVDLVHQGGGRYTASVRLDHGAWMARVEAAAGDTPYRQVFRFTISPAGDGS
jgi:nitrogen fixation protein FixH